MSKSDESTADKSRPQNITQENASSALPVEIEKPSVFSDLTLWGWLELFVVLAFAIIHHLLTPVLTPAEYAIQRFRSRVRSSVRCGTRPSSSSDGCRRLVPGAELSRRVYQHQYTNTKEGGSSVISRTYVTRVLDGLKDVPKAGTLIASGFAMDPFTRYISSNDPAMQHHFGTSLYSSLLKSPAHQTLVVEWEEQEKLIGVCIVRELTRLSNQALLFPLNCLPTPLKLHLIDFIDHGKWLASLIPSAIQHPLKTLHLYKCLTAMGRRSEHVVPAGIPLLHVKFLATEKGFQGQGVGTDLLKAIFKIHDELTPVAHKKIGYIESSNIANVPLYERFGFKTFVEWHATPQAPPLFLMIRPAVILPKQTKIPAESNPLTLPPLTTSTTTMMPPLVFDSGAVRKRGDAGAPNEGAGGVVTTPRPMGDSVIVSSNEGSIDKPSVTEQSA